MSYYFDEYGFARPAKKLPQNVPYDTWAPQMWQQFDSLGSNFKSSQDFASQVHSLIGQIPCPECKTDGEKYVKTNPPESVASKAQAQGWVKAYHSHVDSVAKGWGDFSDSYYQGQIDVRPEGQPDPGLPGGEHGGGGGGGGSVGHPGAPEGIGRTIAGAPGPGGGGGGGGFYDDNYAMDDQQAKQMIQQIAATMPEGTHTSPGNPGLPGGGGGGPGGGGGGPGGRGGAGGNPWPNVPSRGGTRQNWQGGGSFPQQGYSRDLKDPWYSTMWAQLHEYANDYNPLTFADDVRNQIEEIPAENERCYVNSQEFMRKYPPEYVSNRNHAMYWMCRFHNQASLDAGNGLVDCELDPEGYGYVSGHDDYSRDFFYGGGSRGGGGGQQGGRGGGRKKGRHGGGGRGGGRGGMRGGGGGGMGPMGGQGGYAKGLIGGQRVPTSRNAPYCRGNLVEADGILYCSTREHPFTPTRPEHPPRNILPEKYIEDKTRNTERSQRISIA